MLNEVVSDTGSNGYGQVAAFVENNVTCYVCMCVNLANRNLLAVRSTNHRGSDMEKVLRSVACLCTDSLHHPRIRLDWEEGEQTYFYCSLPNFNAPYVQNIIL